MADLAPQLLAALKGDKGLYPINGGYDPAQAYRKDTVLRDNGSQWRALQLVPPATPPAEGAYWTKFIDGTPVANAAQVAADRVLSQAAAATSTSAMDSVSASALQVAGNLTASQLAAQSAVAASGLSNLSAAARAIALDAGVLAVHVYDTRRDSDGGAWVQKANTSINNEPLNTATRGATARYPTVMLLVVTAGALTIYDADDPACPMWAVFSAAGFNLFNAAGLGPATTVTAQQGVIAVGTISVGFWAIDLIRDNSDRFSSGPTSNTGAYLGNLSQRNANLGRDGLNGSYLGGPRITTVSGGMSCIAMTVVPQTAPDPARFGLPNPTIAMAASVGVSMIRHDGTTVNSSSTTAMGRVSFDKNGTLYATASGVNTAILIYDYPVYLSSSFVHAALINTTTPASMVVTPTGPSFVKSAGDRIAIGAATAGLTLLNRHRGILANSMVAYIEDWRNTLNQIGATKMAGAESLRVLSLLQSTELLTNGAFTTDLSSWTSDDQGTGFAASAWDAGNGGRLKVERLNGTNRAGRAQNITTVVGQTYRVVVVVSGANGFVAVGVVGNNAPIGTTTLQFRATSTTTPIAVRASGDGSIAYIDDISIKAVVADHSPSGNHLEVVGTLNRTVVAAGAELAAIGGFSISNYAQAPYNASLDPGSGEFSIHTCIVTPNGLTWGTCLLDRSAPSGTGAYYRLTTDGTGKPRFSISDGTNVANVIAPYALAPGAHRLRGIRRASPARIEIEVDGQVVATTALSTMGSLTNASAVLRLGLYVTGTLPMDATGPGLTAFGVSMTAPSNEQMRTAFADDIQAFQPGAKCLLQGGSGVQDIGYDADTDLIYVAKSAGGTDIFQGIVNKGTILSTTSANLMPGAGTPGSGTSVSAATASLPVAGPASWGSSKAIALSENAANATHVLSFPSPVIPVGPCVQGIAVKAGTRNWVCLNTTIGFVYVNLSDGTSGVAGAGGAALSSVSLGNGWWLIQLLGTGTGAASIFRVQAAITNNNSTYTGDGGALPAIYIGDPMVRAGSTPLTAADFRIAQSWSDNHKLVSAHDGNVLIATATGADIVMPALPLRSGVRGRRSAALYDADVSKFNGRTTADATPTFIGDPILVPEGGKVDFLISVTAAVPGGTASELVTTLLKGRAHRNIGDAAATVFVSAVSGSPALPDKTTGTMDATVASMGGGWIGVRVTGKAATTIEWLGRQSLVRAA